MSGVTAVVIPDALDELLTPQWLTAALAPRFPGVQIANVIRGPVVERVSTNARFRIECASAPPPALPSTLCVKGYFSETGRSSAQAGEPEASFYRDLADATGVHTLRSVWAGVHPETRHGVVITEDVIAAGGVFRDALSPCSVEQTAAVLGELARLHSHSWEHPADAYAPWLVPRVAQTLRARGLPEIRRNFEGPLGPGVPDAIRDPQQLVDAYRILAAREPGAGWTVIHGDMHVGNTFLDATGRPALLDWQLVQRGHWSIDVGYHIASALEPEQRAVAERDLLAHYLDRLAAEGVNPPSFESAWDEYRRGIAYGFFLWGITQYVAQEIIGVLLVRLSRAALELESYRALHEL
jgi:hypothetical protein